MLGKAQQPARVVPAGKRSPRYGHLSALDSRTLSPTHSSGLGEMRELMEALFSPH